MTTVNLWMEKEEGGGWSEGEVEEEKEGRRWSKEEKEEGKKWSKEEKGGSGVRKRREERGGLEKEEVE